MRMKLMSSGFTSQKPIERNRSARHISMRHAEDSHATVLFMQVVLEMFQRGEQRQ